MKGNKPKVSILCLTYNQEKFIEQTLNSFLMQKTNFNFEILINDDASTDKTAEIIKEYQKKYPEIIKPIFQTKNQYSKKTIHGMLNKFLLPLAKGKYIALCEGDDYWCDKNKLQISVDTLDKNLDCIMFVHNTIIQKSNNKKMLIVPNNPNFKENKFSLTNSIYTHLSARVFRNIKHIPPGDIFQYHFLLSKGLCYYYDKPMSIYRYNKKGIWSFLDKVQQERENIRIYYLINLFFKRKYNKFYSKSMPKEFDFYNKTLDKDSSWILYMIIKGYSYSDVFNAKTKFVKAPIKEKIIWKILWKILKQKENINTT